MKFGIYILPGHPVLPALEHGIRELHGEVHRRHPGVFSPDQAEAFDVVVGLTRHSSFETLQLAYLPKDRQVVGIGPGLLKEDHLCLTLDHDRWIPPFECNHDRLDRMGVEFGGPGKGKSILLCGQPSDSQREMVRGQYIEWVRDTVRDLRAFSSDPIIWRPAGENFSVEGVDEVDTGSLEASLEKARVVVTHSGIEGLEALMRGLPVITFAPTVYGDLASQLRDLPLIKAPEAGAVRDLFARLAYAQWTKEEIATGRPLQFLLDCAADRVPDYAKAKPKPAKSTTKATKSTRTTKATAAKATATKATATKATAAKTPAKPTTKEPSKPGTKAAGDSKP